MKTHFFVDIHCHSSIKAYARSFAHQPGIQSGNPAESSSIWHRDAPSLFDKIKNYTFGLTNFIQADGTSLIRGHVHVVFLSFYPQEKGFFVNRLGTGGLSDALTKLASEFGQERIDHIQAMSSYWEDLKTEMNFLLQQQNSVVMIDDQPVSYRIARNYADVVTADEDAANGGIRILFIPTIEGGHVFDQVMNAKEPWNAHPGGITPGALAIVLQRVADLRAGSGDLLRLVFITFAHHFWNGLCGQARSLSGFVKMVVDQENGLDTGFTDAGHQVVRALLGTQLNAEGAALPPIYIDIKHMSRQSRLDYFAQLDAEFAGQSIPVIASHAGVTGLSGPGGIAQTPAAKEGLYMTESINFYDDEILRVARSGGILGIQLDERRIGSKKALKKARGKLKQRDILYNWAGLVWNQVRHIAELLDQNKLDAWSIQCLGTDFDGIIDPLNGYWTAQQLDQLDDYLLMHVFNYLREVKSPCPLQQPANRAVTPEEVVDRVMTGNALRFLSRYFN